MDFIELYNWWFDNKKVWFNSSSKDDEEITDKWEYLLEIKFKKEDEDEYFNNIKKGIGYILTNDQIIRHIVRHKKLENLIINQYLDNILDFVKKFYEYNKDKLFKHDFCFTLLPMRHTKIFENCEFVIKKTWELLENNKEDNESVLIYKNYLKASYERNSFKNIENIENVKNDKNVKYNIHEDIVNFILKYSDIMDTKCLEYINSKNYLNFDLNNKIVLELKKINITKNIILSISGGIDSIIISWILKKLNYNFAMVHINYANRNECELEKQFLKEWANYLNINLFYKDIYEINRPKCMKYDMRNLYECYTRDVRYNSYLQVSENMNWDNYDVILGHNNDDCFENILTNITSKNKYNNLNGMENLSIINFKNKNINFLRPMLSITKKEIFEYANINNIPFLVDSTPKWSQRGKIRDIVRPCLEKWNLASINGIFELSNILSESLDCISILSDGWFIKLKNLSELDEKDKINYLNKYTLDNKFIKININELNYSKIFWNNFLKKINFEISNKTINELISKFNIIKKNFDKYQIKQPSEIQISKFNKIIFWKSFNNELILVFIKYKF